MTVLSVLVSEHRSQLEYVLRNSICRRDGTFRGASPLNAEFPGHRTSTLPEGWPARDRREDPHSTASFPRL